MLKRVKKNWHLPQGYELTDFDKRILSYQNRGELVPTRELIKTPEQIEGIRRSGEVNTGVLDLIEREIHAGMSTADIDKLVYDYTVSHGAIPAPLNYEGFPKSVCTSINEVVCHGIPSEYEILEEGDIISINIPENKIELKVDEAVLNERMKNFVPKKKELSGYLKRYAALVSSGASGAILN